MDPGADRTGQQVRWPVYYGVQVQYRILHLHSVLYSTGGGKRVWGNELEALGEANYPPLPHDAPIMCVCWIISICCMYSAQTIYMQRAAHGRDPSPHAGCVACVNTPLSFSIGLFALPPTDSELRGEQHRDKQ
jgi:hypothetical protein